MLKMLTLQSFINFFFSFLSYATLKGCGRGEYITCCLEMFAWLVIGPSRGRGLCYLSWNVHVRVRRKINIQRVRKFCVYVSSSEQYSRRTFLTFKNHNLQTPISFMKSNSGVNTCLMKTLSTTKVKCSTKSVD